MACPDGDPIRWRIYAALGGDELRLSDRDPKTSMTPYQKDFTTPGIGTVL